MPSTTDFAVLRDIRRNGHLIPFIGAGLSVPLGLPSWTSLIDVIAEQLGYDPRVFRLNGNSYQLAEYYVATKGSIGPLRSEMDRLFNPTDASITSVALAHRARRHAAAGDLHDQLRSDHRARLCAEDKSQCHTIASIDDIATAPADATQIIKFHGTFDDDASLVLTESSYFDRLEFESAIDIKLRADMLGKCLLFIGYSLNDVNIRYMLYKLHKLRHQVRRDTNRTPQRVPGDLWRGRGSASAARAVGCVGRRPRPDEQDRQHGGVPGIAGMKIYFATSSSGRRRSSTIFSRPLPRPMRGGTELLVYSSDLPEVLDCDIDRIVTQKAIDGYQQLALPCVVEHSGLFMDALPGLPGGLGQIIWKSIGERMCDFLRSDDSRAATARSVVGYCDGRHVRLFAGETRGRVAERARGDYAFNWDPIFIPDGSDRTYGEMGLQGKRETSPVHKAWTKFFTALSTGDHHALS